jgi:heme exporter protein A
LTTHGTALSARGVAVWRGDRCLFEGLDFDLHACQLALIVGPNGAGKTTLLRVLAGLAPPTAGTVTWNDAPIGSLPPERRAEIAYRGHLDGLKKDLTVAENLEFHASIWGAAADVGALLAELHLTEAAATRVRNLSAGQRRRTALATLPLTAAKLWVLDEPSTNLDSDGRATVTRWTRRHLEEGGAAVIATHQPEEFSTPGAMMIEL